jgi:glyceraldehyde 3-phosphate dehydrogenase
MAVKVAINGFGRIGRLVFRAIVDQGLLGDQVEVVAVNDLVPAGNLAYLLKYDTTQGRFNGTVEAEGDDALVVNGQKIKCLALREIPANLPWAELGIDIVIESTGLGFRMRRLRVTSTQVPRKLSFPLLERVTE